MRIYFAIAGALLIGATAFRGGTANPPVAGQIRFTDITQKAGIRFVHHSGATGKMYLPETMGSGCAFIDYDGDGYPDILLLNSKDWTPTGKHYFSALYHNNRNGTFTDVTKGSGLDVEMYAMGVAVADYDNDGRPDLYITALEGDRLFHNEGNGKFRDVTALSGIKNAGFGTSAAWLDYDRDGKVDLFVANYVQWSPQNDPWCSLDGTHKSYCTPDTSKGLPSKLYRNLGNGKFQDVTAKAGILDPKKENSKSLGVLVVDYNNDGWPDLFIANDTQRNKLYRNNKNGTFTEEGESAGVAYGEDGNARGAMGVDWADYDHSGWPSIVVGNFSNQMLAIYHNEGTGLFTDVAASSNVGRATMLDLTFGAFFFDYDLDGYADILAANGHTENDIERVQPKVQFKEPPQLFHNQQGRGFEDASRSVGPDFMRPLVARGSAYADIDRDGDLDVLITNNEGSPVLFRNDGGNRNKWLNLRLRGTKSNRSALGATVRIESALGKQWNTVRSGGSYCSQSDLALTFGLAQDPVVKTIDIEWPGGTRQHFTNIAPNQFLQIDEIRGILK
ncbi:CRTAC1 family protein [Nevskia soli]|uniref:CRTAC1 family protein n=1 Tax=Nevskia soli TaxID=418856 RepID=UPI0015D67B06|nr:CRTAC1 family protein [Nevskia soli]